MPGAGRAPRPALQWISASGMHWLRMLRPIMDEA
jgi:hypothetical protein